MHRYLHRAATGAVAALLVGGLVIAHPFSAGAAATNQALVVTGAGPGGAPHVRLFTANGQPTATSFYAYDPAFLGGVDVALADLDGDGRAEIITAAGPGGAPSVRVFNLAGQPIDKWSFYAYDQSFSGGVHLGVSDVDGDGKQEIVTGAGPGGAPHVKVWELNTDTDKPAPIRSFYAYDQGFSGGVYATGIYNTDSDNTGIVTGAGPGGAPHVKVFTPAADATTASFYAYDSGFHGGVNVEGFNIHDEGVDSIITGAGPGGAPHVRDFTAAGLPDGSGFYAYSQNFSGGVDVGAFIGNEDSLESTLTAPMSGTAPILSWTEAHTVGAFSGLTPQPYPGFTGGIHIAGGVSLFDPSNPSGTTSTTGATTTTTAPTTTTTMATTTTTSAGSSSNS